MSEISASLIKELRVRTNAGVMDCKDALRESDGDLEKAVDALRKKGLATALKRAGREASEGTIQAYIHGGGKIGVLVELNCETDFVAKTDDFKNFTRDLAMHIAAARPLGVTKEELPEAVIQREADIYRAQAAETGKPANIIEKIVQGKMEKFYQDACLLSQAYVKNPDLTIQDMIHDLISRTGEKISVRRFARFQIGEE